ncbi:MAG: hypothetical protein ACM31G_06000, partial [Flavobacteriales bacterium]
MKRLNILKICLSFCLGFLSLQMNSQDLLTLDEAVQIALKNNYEIRLASNNLDIDSLSVSLGFAGILPRAVCCLPFRGQSQRPADGDSG